MSPSPLSGSLLVTASSVKPTGPESASATVTEMLIGTSLPFGGQRTLGFALHDTFGNVLSMSKPFTTCIAEFPARSSQVPVTDWFAPSVETTVVAGGLPEARPERLSAQVKLTVTSVLF